MYVFRGASLGCLFLKIICYTFHKNEAFPKYVFGNCSLGRHSGKILTNFIDMRISPACVHRCFFRLYFRENSFLQISQTWSFFPVYVRRCFISGLSEKILSYKFHKYPKVNPLLQISHIWGFPPVCFRRCFFRSSLIHNSLLQISQTSGLSPVCV